MAFDYLRLHLVPRRAITQESATLEDCVSHAEHVADALAQGLARSMKDIIMLDPYPSEGGMRYLLRGNAIEVAYGVFLGDYFDSEILSERLRAKSHQSPPALKSYLLVADPFGRRERALIAATIAMYTDMIINHEAGDPKGWQAFLRRYDRSMLGGFKITSCTVRHGYSLLAELGISPFEWVARTTNGYEPRSAHDNFH